MFQTIEDYFSYYIYIFIPVIQCAPFSKINNVKAASNREVTGGFAYV